MKKHDDHAPNFTCNNCNNEFARQIELDRHHRKEHRTSSQLNCDECAFQAHTGAELKKHINAKCHRPAGGINTSQLGDTKECNICRDEFSDWWNLMNHRRDTHPERRRMCRNDLKGICSYESSECWWKHRVEAPLTSTNSQDKDEECTICEEMFVTKSEVMMHKKSQHEESVPVCYKFKGGKCDFPPNKCWYKHCTVGEKPREAHEKNPPSNPLVFHQDSSQIKPPELKLEELKTIMAQAMLMMTSVAKRLEELDN